MRLLDVLERHRPQFEKGGRFERLEPVWEMVETILYTPATVTTGTCHVRDGLDLKRMMSLVVVALVPCMAMAFYNTGYQAHLLIEHGGAPLPGWRESLFVALGFGHSSADLLACTVYGALHFVPALVVCLAAGGVMEAGFAIVRRGSVEEGFLVTSFLLPLTLPPTIPLWQVALGTAFGVVIGKEIFGGTGMNFLNPALVARAFLFFAYPEQLSGEVWVAAVGPDGTSGATWLAHLAAGTEATGIAGPWTWQDAFLGTIPGSMGETSVLACLLGAGFLLATGIASWRTMLGCTLGTLAMAYLLNAVGSSTNPMFAVPFHWHVVLGGWAFGMVFMATDPVSSPFTLRGRFVYGCAIGVLVVLVRVVNPAYPEGMMLAILFMNMLAPVIDHVQVRANVRRRLARHGG